MSEPSDFARKYADYETKVGHPANRSWYITEGENAKLVKVVCAIRRIPSTKQFWMYPMEGITESEFQAAKSWLEGMPRGGWAETRLWRRGANVGRKQTFIHAFGVAVDDPLERLKLEMAIDLTSG